MLVLLTLKRQYMMPWDENGLVLIYNHYQDVNRVSTSITKGVHKKNYPTL